MNGIQKIIRLFCVICLLFCLDSLNSEQCHKIVDQDTMLAKVNVANTIECDRQGDKNISKKINIFFTGCMQGLTGVILLKLCKLNLGLWVLAKLIGDFFVEPGVVIFGIADCMVFASVFIVFGYSLSLFYKSFNNFFELLSPFFKKDRFKKGRFKKKRFKKNDQAVIAQSI